MIHPPPASFAAATAVRRSPRTERSAAPLRALTWVLAAAIVTGAHLGIYAVLVHAPTADTPPPPVSPAAVMIDLAPTPTVARSEVDNQAKGPASTAQDEATPPEEQAPPPETAITAPPPPPDLRSEAVLAPAQPKPEVKTTEARKPETPAPPAKPHKKAEAIKTPNRPREERVVASRNGGGPRSDQRTADRTAAPMAGDTSSADVRAAWQSEVRSRIVRSKRFPSEAHGTTGVALVSVTFTASGGASNVRLVASSGNAALDAEAVAVMSRAAPYPPPPGGRAIALTIPLNFRR